VTKFQWDLAISAVASDAEFVNEFIAEFGTRLQAVAAWEPALRGSLGEAPAALGAGRSRLALVLHQQLWGHDDATRQDAAVLRERLATRPGSACVMMLDAATVPSWLSALPTYELATAGRTGAVEFVAGAVASGGGSVRPAAPPATAAADAPRWPDPPTPFMAQPRAFTALRHEFDALVAQLEAIVEERRAAQPERLVELQVLPHRAVARLDDVAISFSWVSGRASTVAEGRLMVIAWNDVAYGLRGLDALRSAKPVHERVYRAEGATPDEWRWRADDLTGQPYSSTNLAAQWVARASIAKSPAVR